MRQKNKEKKETQSSSVRLEKTNYEKLKVIAGSNKRSINAEIELLVEKHIASYEKKNGLITLNEMPQAKNGKVTNVLNSGVINQVGDNTFNEK